MGASFAAYNFPSFLGSINSQWLDLIWEGSKSNKRPKVKNCFCHLQKIPYSLNLASPKRARGHHNGPPKEVRLARPLSRLDFVEYILVVAAAPHQQCGCHCAGLVCQKYIIVALNSSKIPGRAKYVTKDFFGEFFKSFKLEKLSNWTFTLPDCH